jgi:RNA recognition motif-containing protein
MVRETRHLWVGNLPESIREDRIIDHFKRYGKVQSVKILPKNKSDESNASNSTTTVTTNNLNGVSATVAFIDIKSAAKAHNSENKIEERTLKTDYYEPPASSTALSAIYIHEREDAHIVQKPSVYGNANANSRPGRHTPSRLSDERIYDSRDRTSSCNDYERIVERDSPYIKRNISYLDDSDYSNRSRSRDRPFSRNVNNSYGDGIERSQTHFRPYARNSSQTHFEAQRYPSSEQLEETNVNSNTSSTSSTQRGSASRRITSVTTTSGGVSSTVSSPPHLKPLKKKKKKKSLRSHSASPSPSRSSSLSSTRSQSPSSSSNISTSSASSRTPSPSKSQSSPLSLYSNRKGSLHCTERPISGNSAVLISAVTTTTNNISTSSQGSNHTPLHNSSATPGSDSSADKDDTRPLAICVKNLPVRSTDSSLKDGLFHEYKKHGKVTMVKVVGQGTDRFAVVCFKKPEDVDKALVESKVSVCNNIWHFHFKMIESNDNREYNLFYLLIFRINYFLAVRSKFLLTKVLTQKIMISDH